MESSSNDPIILQIDLALRNINFVEELKLLLRDDLFRVNYDPKNKLNYKKREAIILPDNEIIDGKNIDFEKNLCKKMLFDKMTEMISKDVCFKDDRQLYIVRFQYLVNNFFKSAINQYINNKNLEKTDILFLYKGGTTMKILYQKYKEILMEKNNLRLLENFFENSKKNFERSDSDYTIYINPDVEKRGFSFEEINRDMIGMSIIVLRYVRNIINYFDNEILSQDLITDEILKNQVENFNKKIEETRDSEKFPYCTNLRKIKKIIGISSKNNSYFSENIPELKSTDLDFSFEDKQEEILKSNEYANFLAYKKVSPVKKDFLMTKNEENKNTIIPLNTKDNIYLSVNETVEFGQNNIISAFTLNRLKINFICYYLTLDGKYGFFNCPSELVDVSILKSYSTHLPYFYEHNMNKEYKEYVYNFQDKKTFVNLKYNGYTIFGNLNDLILVLLIQFEFPWDDGKYKKRLQRLIFFLVLEIIISLNFNINSVNEIINLLKNLFVIKLQNNNDLQNIEQIKQYLKNIKLIFELNNLNLHDLASTNFFEKFEKLFKKTNFDYIKYNEMANDVLLFLFELNELNINKINLPPNDTGLIETVNQIGGKYYLKYQKYKNKYISLKNNI